MTRLSLAVALSLASCAQPLSDVELVVWQPEGALGDLLAAPDSLTLEVVTEAQTRSESFAQAADVRVGGVVAPIGGGPVSFKLTVERAGALAGLGRALTEVVADGPPAVASLVLAEPDLIHPHTADPTDQRADTTVCVDPNGLLLIASGQSGANLSGGTIVVDSIERRVRPGPALAVPRRRAACVAGADVVWLFGGCDLNDQPIGGLLRADGLGEDDEFVEIVAPGGAGCDAGIALLESGGLALNYGDEVEVRDADGQSLAPRLAITPPRFGATVVSFPGDDRFAISGGRDQTGVLQNTTLIVRLNENALVVVNTSPGILATADGAAVFALDGDDLIRIEDDGTTAVEADAELPAGFTPNRLVAAAGLFAFFDAEGTAIRVAGARLGAFGLPAGAPRPGGYVFPDPGGALFLVGGGTPGVDVLVLE